MVQVVLANTYNSATQSGKHWLIMYLLLKLKRPLWNPSCYSACLPSSRFDLPARSSSSARRLLPPRGLTIAEISLGPDEGERKQTLWCGQRSGVIKALPHRRGVTHQVLKVTPPVSLTSVCARARDCRQSERAQLADLKQSTLRAPANRQPCPTPGSVLSPGGRGRG